MVPDNLTENVGPLPVYAWGLLLGGGVVGYSAYRRHKNGQAQAINNAPTVADSGTTDANGNAADGTQANPVLGDGVTPGGATPVINVTVNALPPVKSSPPKAPEPTPVRPKPPVTKRPMPILREGDHGAYVRLLQQHLRMTATGDFDAHTKARVEAFQRAHHLTPDGVVGAATWHALGF